MDKVKSSYQIGPGINNRGTAGLNSSSSVKGSMEDMGAEVHPGGNPFFLSLLKSRLACNL
jgi:hypothetical protein